MQYSGESSMEALENSNKELLLRIAEIKNKYLALSKESLKFMDRFYRSPAGYVILNDQGVITDCNPGFAARVLAFPIKLRGTPLVDHISPSYHEAYSALLKSVRSAYSPKTALVEFLCADRTVFQSYVVINHFSRNPGLTSGEYRVVIVDNFGCEQAELAARKEREKARLYFEIAGVIMIVLSADGTVSEINRKGAEVLECPAEMAVGKNWFDTFLPVKIRENVRAVFKRILAGEMTDVEFHENPVITLTGKEKTIAWRNALMRNDAGEVFAVLSSGVDISSQLKAEAQLRIRAALDPLTGVLNRREGVAALESAVAQCAAEGKPATVCLVDLNKLKYVNDNFGHGEGDEVIIQTVRIITCNIKKTDVVFRLGGDEFLIVFKNCNSELAEMALNRIDGEREKHNATCGKPYNIGWCYGIEEWNAQTSGTVEDLIRRADEKMYHRKKTLPAEAL